MQRRCAALVARGERAVFRDHGMKGRDGDALGAVKTPVGPHYVIGIVPEMVGERALGLPCQRNPVDEEQHGGDDARLKQPFDEGRRGAGLPVPVAISTSSLRRPSNTSADSASMHSIGSSWSTIFRLIVILDRSRRIRRAAIRRLGSSCA